jgi:hypothetical protein
MATGSEPRRSSRHPQGDGDQVEKPPVNEGVNKANLRSRYGAIGISAVVAALQYKNDVKEPGRRKAGGSISAHICCAPRKGRKPIRRAGRNGSLAQRHTVRRLPRMSPTNPRPLWERTIVIVRTFIPLNQRVKRDVNCDPKSRLHIGNTLWKLAHSGLGS